jgi:hypothetical protein
MAVMAVTMAVATVAPITEAEDDAVIIKRRQKS